MNHFFSLEKKNVVVTGAGSGIGEAIAKRFAADGASVCLVDLNEENIKKVAETIIASGGKAQCQVLNVASEEDCQAFAVEYARKNPQGIDVLVNNAGVGHVGTILETELKDLDRMHSINVGGVFNLSRAFLPVMLDKQSGSIINMASIGGVVGVLDRVAYCASKFAVVGLTKSMAIDHAKSGVRINCICPARVRTPFVEARLKEYPDPEAAYRQMSSTQPVGRMAEPEEIAAAAHYLAADESAFVTGTAFEIDGGYSAI